MEHKSLKDNDLPEDTDEGVFAYREDYAKMALLMFYPFRCKNDLRLEDSYWKKYKKELSEYLDYVERKRTVQNDEATQGGQEEGQGEEEDQQEEEKAGVGGLSGDGKKACVRDEEGFT